MQDHLKVLMDYRKRVVSDQEKQWGTVVEDYEIDVLLYNNWRVKIYLNKLRSNPRDGKYDEILLSRPGCFGTCQNKLSISRDEQLD